MATQGLVIRYHKQALMIIMQNNHATCSSPILFALYLVDWGRALEATEEGILLGGVRIPALLFADDLLLCASNPKGLRILLDVSEREARAIKSEISEKKSMVISQAVTTWDLHDEKGEVYSSLDKVLSYKYLGVEAYNTMTRVSTAKQKKCVKAAERYRGATKYLSRQGPDVVDLAVVAWRRQAVPAVTFGTENIIFSNSTLESLERVQGGWARNTLDLPQSCPGVAAQLLLGAPTFKQVIYHKRMGVCKSLYGNVRVNKRIFTKPPCMIRTRLTIVGRF